MTARPFWWSPPPFNAPAFDARWVTLSDDVTFLTLAASPVLGEGAGAGIGGAMPAATMHALRRVVLARARVVRVHFVVSKPGVPLSALLPAAAKVTVLSAGSSGAAPPMLPTVACPMRLVLRELAGAHDAATSGSEAAAGVAGAEQLLAHSPEAGGVSKTRSACEAALARSCPLVIVPFFCAGDGAWGLAPLLGSASGGTPALHASARGPAHYHPAALLSDGGYWTTGGVVEEEAAAAAASSVAAPAAAAASKPPLRVLVALEHEERRVWVEWALCTPLATAQGCSLRPTPLALASLNTEAARPYPGDRVALRVRSAAAQLALEASSPTAAAAAAHRAPCSLFGAAFPPLAPSRPFWRCPARGTARARPTAPLLGQPAALAARWQRPRPLRSWQCRERAAAGAAFSSGPSLAQCWTPPCKPWQQPPLQLAVQPLLLLLLLLPPPRPVAQSATRPSLAPSQRCCCVGGSCGALPAP
jgi:hypothetical protein